MKHLALFSFCLILTTSAYTGFAQTLSNDYLQEMQRADPLAAAALSRAIQQGDFEAAQKTYQEFSRKQERERDARPSALPAKKPATPSLLERTLSADVPPALSTSLQQFGYDTFNQTVSTFSPVGNVPVGPGYIIGPGDQFTITTWGTTEGIYTVRVTKEGKITLPKVGVVPVAGLRFGKLERTLRRHLSKYYSNFNLSVAMGELKTITVYVVGEVSRPGSYSVNSLTTAYGALFAAGGPTKKGTMRSIQVLRSGRILKTIDLYDFLLRGDRSLDMKLRHEDTVFVPLIGPVAAVAGTVFRPAIYEMKGQETIGGLIQSAGGIMPIAIASRLQLYRFAENRKKVILDIELSKATSPAKKAPELRQKARNMDLISILPIYDKVWEMVSVRGHVRHPGDFEWKEGLRLKDIIRKAQLLPTTDLRRGEVIRLTKDYMNREILPVNLSALMDDDASQNIALQPRDQIRIYTTYRKDETVAITGEVLRPGTYEIKKGERLSDLLRRAGGYTEEAFPSGAVFQRTGIKNMQEKNLRTFITRLQAQILQAASGGVATALNTEEAAFHRAELNLNQSLLNNLRAMQEQFEGRIAITIDGNIDEWAGSKNDLLLQDGDSIQIPKRPQEVSVMGEINSPGAQIFHESMKVKTAIGRAGGYAKYADTDQIFIIRANGFSLSADSPSVGNVENIVLNPGDTVFVPQKVERYAGMRFTKDIIDILFKTAVVIATITVLF